MTRSKALIARAVLAVAATAVLASCTSTKAASVKTKSVSATAAADAKATGDHGSTTGDHSSSDVHASAGSSSPTTTKAASAKTGTSPTSSTTSTTLLAPDMVWAGPVPTNTDDPRPQGCTFQHGQVCRFRINGTYRMTTEDAGSILVGAYEDGSDTPASSVTLPGAKRPGSRFYIDQFFYKPGANAKKVVFVATLIGADGKVLAKSTPTYTFPIS